MFEDEDAAGDGEDPRGDALVAALVAAVDALAAADDPVGLGFEGQLDRLWAVSRQIDRMEAHRVRLLGGGGTLGCVDR